MTPARARAMLRRHLAKRGEIVTVKRFTDAGEVAAQALARIRNYTAEEIASGIVQGNRKAVVLAEDLETAGFPLPLQINDGLFVGERRLNIESVDDSTRRIGGTVIGYDLGVQG